ncbi:CHY zinc finger protein [Halalkalibacillus halophilus]|uniref:CHY zinc finger protein n=1 Tax=Halalkalibacillus halophilus TaxID=392827 RepID=UPI0009FBADDD|nr:CHY zinc finger protein [Halalkalibacillus halophilus]
MFVFGQEVIGTKVDPYTKCEHYHSSVDIIAIKFKCCDTYYPCYKCHEENTEHPIDRWAIEERDTKAILCGKCGHQLTINEYMQSANSCTNCNATFNVHCKNHHHLYFEL